ncbi:Rha family transcriptional regulator [Sphaerotilus sp.]|uniref:Rha family transcriptional regulator n=1 Tax=Sphaerotilus sp. TaxID=2093942 RepID=UPI002601405B|nr:Rha family transcriptional regulator [Sphaerotilus sp.]
MKPTTFSGSAAGVSETTHRTASPHAGTSGDLFPRASLAELVQPVHEQPMTTSRRVAQMFGKEHKNVLRSVERLLPDLPDEFSRLNFEPRTYTDDRGKEQPEYLLTQDGFIMLAMGFTGREAVYWRATFIKAFNALGKEIRRRDKALLSRERELIRAEVARTHSTVNAVLTDTRAEQGKTTEARHYINEARLIGYAMTGQCSEIDRSTLDAQALRLLRWVEMQDIKLLSRGVCDHHTRKTELRALVLKAQAITQALEAGDAEPLQSIGGAA